jgi:hypothetical protein
MEFDHAVEQISHHYELKKPSSRNGRDRVVLTLRRVALTLHFTNVE